MYEAVLEDGGIWEYSEDVGDFSEKLRTMWVLETCILICSCWLGGQKKQNIVPEDMELRGENIPSFLDFLEGLPNSPPDCGRLPSPLEVKTEIEQAFPDVVVLDVESGTLLRTEVF